MMLRFLFLLPVLLFSACSKPEKADADHAELETPAGEAVLRHVLSVCPHRGEARQLTIVLGERMEPASQAFEGKFSDTGLLVTPSKKLEAGMANGQVRIYDSVTQEPPIIIQLSSLVEEPAAVPTFKAKAAWSWKDKAKRFIYTVKAKADGAFDIKQEEEVPIAPRNQDGMRGVK